MSRRRGLVLGIGSPIALAFLAAAVARLLGGNGWLVHGQGWLLTLVQGWFR